MSQNAQIDFDALFKSFERHREDIRSGSTAFDFCFNYFQQFKDSNIRSLGDPEISVAAAAQLASYLASWRMYRGSSYISKRSFQIYVPFVQEISKEEWVVLWNIDSMTSLVEHSNEVVCFAQLIKRIITNEGKDVEGSITDTLVSKILLGVFGFLPGLDRYFTKGMTTLGYPVNVINSLSIQRLGDFYTQNRKILDSKNYKTLDVKTGQQTNRSYPIGRLIDIIGFEYGDYLLKKEKKTT